MVVFPPAANAMFRAITRPGLRVGSVVGPRRQVLDEAWRCSPAVSLVLRGNGASVGPHAHCIRRVRALSSFPVDDGAGQWSLSGSNPVMGGTVPGFSGPHDLGGIAEEMGRVIDRSEGPLEQWELQTHALLVLLASKHLLRVDELRRCVESLSPAQYSTYSYYEKWAVAMVKGSLERGTFSNEELDKSFGLPPTDASARAPAFQRGQCVQIKREDSPTRWRKPHLRVPGYIFGAKGVVESYVGVFSDPEFLAFRGDPARTDHLYRVRFQHGDVWPECEDADDSIDVEVYESWIAAAGDGNTSMVQSPMFRSTDVPQHAHDHSHSHSHSHLHDGNRGDVAHDHSGPANANHDDALDQAHHDHGHDHDHSHLPRGRLEQLAVDAEGTERPGERIALALLDVLRRKCIIDMEELGRVMEAIETIGSQYEGPRIVARAWSDPGFKARLLEDASGAVEELGISATNSTTKTKLKVVESSSSVHNLVVCTLCSCYPLSILGLSPPWYKSRSYRARAVREPRKMLADSFGLELPTETKVRVHDSTADLRYIVLPARPAGTEGWPEDKLARLVTRDSLIGVGVPQDPSNVDKDE